MHAAAATEPRSTYQAWGGFRNPEPDAYPVRSMWKDTVLVTNGEGREECFAIGPDGYVWSYETGDDAQSQGAGRLVSTGLSGQCFGLGACAGGLLAVLAVEGGELRYTMETYDTHRRWSEPRALDFPGQGESPDVEHVLTQTRGDNLFIAFIVRRRDAQGGTQRLLWEAVWAGDGPVLAAAPVPMAHGHAFWKSQIARFMTGGRA